MEFAMWRVAEPDARRMDPHAAGALRDFRDNKPESAVTDAQPSLYVAERPGGGLAECIELILRSYTTPLDNEVSIQAHKVLGY